MFGFVIFVHAAICVFLITIILMQSGRGGGLTENFSAAESIFGAKTNVILVKATTVLASIFLVTCLSLAFLSTTRNRSLMTGSSAVNQAGTTHSGGMPVQEPSVNSVVESKKADESINQQVLENQKVAEPKETKNPQ